MVNRRELLGLGIAGLASALPGVAKALEPGSFSGNPAVTLLVGRNVEFLSEFRYKDPQGKLWKVPKGFVSDGASIPRIIWPIAGGPLDGPYRDAAFVHDRYCDSMERSWEATHEVFYEAMRSRGISNNEATKKYWAVYYFGPRWNNQYRWTGLMELGKRIRPDKYVGPSPPPPPPPTPEEIAARLAAQEKQFQAELREFNRAVNQIDQLNLGPKDVPALTPEAS